jgi:hypothetical protein
VSRLTPAALGLGAGIVSGLAAEASSDIYADEDRSAMRATAHSGLPFLVAAVVATNRSGPRSATPWRAGFIGVHFVHVRQITRLLRSSGARELRAELAVGAPNYALVLTQTTLLGGPLKTWTGSQRAAHWVDVIDAQLLRTYAVASLVGLVRHRRPLGVYAVISALLAVGFRARRAKAKR